MNTKVRFFLITLDNGQVAYDVRICDPSASIADYLQAQAEFAAQYLADCKGCDGCCHERAPLTILDVERLAALTPGTTYPAHRAVQTFGAISLLDDGAVDIMLQRSLNQNCCLLDTDHQCCTNHQARPFVCRSHFCIGKSDLANQLRSYITNYGLDALILKLYNEEQEGAPAILPEIDPGDYQASPLIGKAHEAEILLKECVPLSFWQQIYEK